MRVIRFVAMLSLCAGFFACETKVDLVEEGKETPVVFGFLEQNLDTQFIKITHSFVTDGSAVEAAMVQELSEYNELEAYVYSLNNDQDTIGTYLLQEKEVTNKDSGAWYWPLQTVYYFTEPIDRDLTYVLSFFGSGVNVSASTPLADLNTGSTNLPIPAKANLVESFDVGGSNYDNLRLRLRSTSPETRRYECTFRFYFTEVYTNGTQQEKTFEINDVFITNGLNGGEDYVFLLEGQQFFERLEGVLSSQNNEENIVRRIIGPMEYEFNYAADELQTYIELSEPSTTVNVQENSYSNVQNGLGIFSSRGNDLFPDNEWGLLSIQELALGQYTGAYKFCSADPAHNGTTYGCN